MGALNMKGTVLDVLGRSEEAIRYSDRAIAIDTRNLDTLLYNIGVVLNSIGGYNEAIEYFDRILAMDPNDILVLDSKEAVAVEDLENPSTVCLDCD